MASPSTNWLGQQGRITEPMIKRPGAEHYAPISWDAAFDIIADHLTALADPDEAIFYTSGYEVVFAYQLFIRAYGTNNLPDCSNMCHESTSVALAETIGIGKASVSLEDVHAASLWLAGQNPGTNHPRMLSALEEAKDRGAKIISINPLREAGLVNFPYPSAPRGSSARARHWPTCTSRSRSTATWRCSRRSARCSCSGMPPSTTTSSTPTPTCSSWRGLSCPGLSTGREVERGIYAYPGAHHPRQPPWRSSSATTCTVHLLGRWG